MLCAERDKYSTVYCVRKHRAAIVAALVCLVALGSGNSCGVFRKLFGVSKPSPAFPTIPAFPSTPFRCLKKGEYYYNSRPPYSIYDTSNFKEAARYFTYIINEWPRDEFTDDALYWLACCYYYLFSFDLAIGAYNEIIKHHTYSEYYEESVRQRDFLLENLNSLVLRDFAVAELLILRKDYSEACRKLLRIRNEYREWPYIGEVEYYISKVC